MRFSVKKVNSKAIGLCYPKDRVEISTILKAEQLNFCAYTEKYLSETDAGDIEHFDDRLKDTLSDDYFNWYFVATWANRGKPKITDYLPIINPEQAFSKNPDQANRISYDQANNTYETVNKPDHEAQNLIDFLDLNNEGLRKDRLNAITGIKDLETIFHNKAQLEDFLLRNPTHLSFITAIETHFRLRLFAQLP